MVGVEALGWDHLLFLAASAECIAHIDLVVGVEDDVMRRPKLVDLVVFVLVVVVVRYDVVEERAETGRVEPVADGEVLFRVIARRVARRRLRACRAVFRGGCVPTSAATATAAASATLHHV